jgi:hypothetical protein
MANVRNIENDNFKYVKTKPLLKAMEEDLRILTNLLSKSELNTIEKGAFIRCFTNLGESLTFFRISHPYLEPVQSLKDLNSEYKFVDNFVYHRNQLLHGYSLERLLGDETRYNNAHAFLVLKNQAGQTNLEQFSKAMSAIKNQDINSMPEELTKEKNPRPTSTLNILDHCFYAIRSIEDLHAKLAAEGLSLNEGASKDIALGVNKFMREKFSENLMPKFIETSIIEIAGHINEYNYQLHKEKINKEPESNPLRKPESLTKVAALAYLKKSAGELRNHAAHEPTGTLGKKKISEALIHFIELKNNYLIHMEKALIEKGYKYSPAIENFLKNVSLENKKATEVSGDVKQDNEDKTSNPIPSHSKRDSQELTLESSSTSKKMKGEKEDSTKNSADISSSRRSDDPFDRFVRKHPDITSYPITPNTTPPNEAQPTTPLTSSEADEHEDPSLPQPSSSSRRSR